VNRFYRKPELKEKKWKKKQSGLFNLSRIISLDKKWQLMHTSGITTISTSRI
jgi:hypothetical protein